MKASPELIEKARSQYGSDDVEVDDDANMCRGDDPGTWVAAWVWIRDSEEGDTSATNGTDR
jgi:hypothetical protein